jgi:uncharacterized protein with FMN-binding domain
VRRMMITLGATVTGTVVVLTYEPSLERAAERVDPADVAGRSLSALAGDQLALTESAQATPDPALDWTDGPEVLTAAGPVQVRVGLDDGALRDVRLVRSPTGSRHSAWLSRHAAMILRAEVLNAQSADVDMISGATYTSAGYLQSLQAALDAAEEGQ